MNNQSAQPRLATPWGAIFSLFTALFYGASPVDLIPELVLPLIGFVDDIVIVPILLILAFFQYRRTQKRNNDVQANSVIVMPPPRAQ